MNVKNEAPTAKGGVDVRMTMVASKLKSAGYMTHQVTAMHSHPRGEWTVV